MASEDRGRTVSRGRHGRLVFRATHLALAALLALAGSGSGTLAAAALVACVAQAVAPAIALVAAVVGVVNAGDWAAVGVTAAGTHSRRGGSGCSRRGGRRRLLLEVKGVVSTDCSRQMGGGR